jgi:hypothetical protein
MTDQQDETEQLSAVLDGLKTDAAAYFNKAKEVFGEVDEDDHSRRWLRRASNDRDSSGRNCPKKIAAKQEG